MANDQALHNAAELGIADLYGELIADANKAESTSMGLHHGHQSAHQFYLQKVADRDTLIRKNQEHGLAPPEAAMKAADTAVERADFERKAAYEDSSRHSKTVAVPAKGLLREAGFYINTQAPYLKVVISPTIKGDPRKALDESTAGIAERRRKKRDWRNRPAPMESVLAAALADLDRYALPVMPTVGEDGHLGWDSSARALDIRGHDKVERVWDARAFFLADPANKKAIRDHIERTVRERYAGIADVATESEKRRALAALDGEILELERRQVAAIRVIRATGEWLPYPASIDVRALLNVAGPNPRPRG